MWTDRPSKVEAANIEAFIAATVALQTNVSFHATSTFAGLQQQQTGAAATEVLILTQASDAGKAAYAQACKDYFDAGAATVLAALGAAAAPGPLLTTFVPQADGASFRRVSVGAAPTKASRDNCALRPDTIVPLVAAAAGAVGKASAGLDIICAFPLEEGGKKQAELALAAAIAKGAGRSFRSQKGAWANGYVDEVKPVRVFLPALLAELAAPLAVVAKNVQRCQRLVDAPTNLLDTLAFAEIAKRCVEQLANATYSQIQGEELREQGYGGLYNVGKAAEFPPTLVTLSYTPQNGIDPQKKIALVGKGMVYDTGGLAIKTPFTGMNGMKCDMGGAAAVFCGFLTAVELAVPVTPIDCVLCLADNAIGPRAFRNNDIIIFKSGRTCEVNNTDAEGRLILSDGVYHAAAEIAPDSPPAVIIDMATLTGAQGIATGINHAGLYTDSEEWLEKMQRYGKECGEMVFPVLFAPEFHDGEYASTVSDGKNSVKNRSNAQVSCAAQFIRANLPAAYKGAHVHVDLASPAFQGDVGTGYGVTLLARTLAPQWQ